MSRVAAAAAVQMQRQYAGALGGRPLDRSLIAEGITKLARHRFREAPADAELSLGVISDGLEESPGIAAMECAPLPSDSAFLARLYHAGALRVGSLRRVHVRLLKMDLSRIDGGRCPSTLTMARADGIERLWRSALTAAGARSVTITAGLPDVGLPDQPAGESAATSQPRRAP